MHASIVSLNCWAGRAGWHRIHQWLERIHVHTDVFCFQEVTALTAGCVTIPGSTRNAATNLFSHLKGALPLHAGIFFPSVRDNTLMRRPSDGADFHYGLASFVRETVPVIESYSTFIHGKYIACLSDPDRVPTSRNVHIMRIHMGERAFCLAHFHGLWSRVGKGDTPERYAMILKLINAVRVLWKEDEPLILMGDFNLLPQSQVLRTLTNELGLRDLVAAHGIASTRTSAYPSDKPSRYADYALVSEGLRVVHFSAPQEPVISDHCPLILQVEM